VKLTKDGQVEPQGVTEKRKGDFFTGVRERGLLNTMLDEPAQKFEALHPELKAKWEHSPASGDTSMVVYREAQGFRLVDAGELGPVTESGQKSGPVRRGDLVLMAAPREVYEAILAADAEAADLDYRTPELTYKEHMRGLQVRLNSGEIRRGKGFGEIRRTMEETSIPHEVAAEVNRSEGGDNA
jgi:hypothetical protein